VTGPDLVSVVVPHHDRVDLLESCVAALASALAGVEHEIVVTDDASPAPAASALAALEGQARVRLVRSEERTGLGANTNRGLRAARGEVVLQVQDDHRLDAGDSEFLRAGRAALDAFPDIGLVRYEVPYALPVAERREVDGWRVAIFDDRVRRAGRHTFDLYSDWPHLKRRHLHETVGFYAEGATMGATELEFSFRVRRAGVKVAVVEGFERCFRDLGAERSLQPSRGTARRAAGLPLSPAKALAAYGWYRLTGRFPFGWYRERG
jgi:GT2 family glycosyltransferase